LAIIARKDHHEDHRDNDQHTKFLEDTEGDGFPVEQWFLKIVGRPVHDIGFFGSVSKAVEGAGTMINSRNAIWTGRRTNGQWNSAGNKEISAFGYMNGEDVGHAF
jgi:hypothetical protein